jgi:hypothetical protein
MNRIYTLLLTSAAIFMCGCAPKLRMTVETRDPQGNVIDRADVTNTDTSGRSFQANGNGTVVLTGLAEDNDGLQALRFEGGYSCNRTGTLQQGTYSAVDPNLPGQHPTSETFQNQFPVLCAGGTYSGTFRACATDAKNGSTCTKDASLHAP